jgi:hypothetical protein
MKNIKKIFSSTITVAAIVAVSWTSLAFASYGDQVLKAGMEGQDVYEIQTTLCLAISGTSLGSPRLFCI